MQHATSFTMFDSYHVGLFTTQTRDFEKIQDGPQSVKRCINEVLKLRQTGDGAAQRLLVS